MSYYNATPTQQRALCTRCRLQEADLPGEYCSECDPDWGSAEELMDDWVSKNSHLWVLMEGDTLTCAHKDLRGYTTYYKYTKLGGKMVRDGHTEVRPTLPDMYPVQSGGEPAGR